MNSNIKKAVIGLVILAVCSVLFYFFYWIKTPAYSLNTMCEAIEKHDIVLFEKHFDSNAFFERAYDDMIRVQEKSSGVSISDNAIGAGVIGMMKDPIVDMMKNRLRENISGAPITSGQDNPATEKLAKNMEKKVPVFNSIEDVSVISKDDLWAHVAVELHDAQLDRNFEVKLKMYRLADDTWQVKECTNFVDVYLERDELVKSRLEELNKGIREQLDAIASFSRESTLVYSDNNPFFPSYTLVNKFSIKNNSGKRINSFVGEYTCPNSGKMDNFIKEYNSDGGLDIDEQSSARVVWDLNPFIEADQYIINKHDSNPHGYNKLVSVTFEDGTVIEILDELPPVTSKE